MIGWIKESLQEWLLEGVEENINSLYASRSQAENEIMQLKTRCTSLETKVERLEQIKQDKKVIGE